MKPTLFLPPAIALIVAGVFVGVQRSSISKLEQESAILRKHIAAANSRQSDTAPDQPLRPDKPKSETDPIDWKEAATVFAEMRNGSGGGDMRKMLSFQSRLQKMDKEQLIAALDQIESLELEEEDRFMLQSMLLGPLSNKDPELTLTRFSNQLGNGNNSLNWILGNALGEWAKKDATSASAWFDKEIAAGTFDSKSLDGKSQARLSFEGSLISQLISTDSAAAEARIAGLPADQRRDALNRMGFSQIKEADQLAFATLVRNQLNSDEQLQLLGRQASNIARQGDLEKVSQYFDAISATPKERVSSAEKAAVENIQRKSNSGKIEAEDIDSMREWVFTQAPESVEKVTGQSIAQASNNGDKMKFADAAAMIMKYHKSSGSDEVLTSFLSNSRTHENKEEARTIAEKISDPKLREQTLKNLE